MLAGLLFDASLFGVAVGRHNTSWGAIASSPHQTISTIELSLSGYDGKPIDLNGQSWSCSITIFRDDKILSVLIKSMSASESSPERSEVISHSDEKESVSDVESEREEPPSILRERPPPVVSQAKRGRPVCKTDSTQRRRRTAAEISEGKNQSRPNES